MQARNRLAPLLLAILAPFTASATNPATPGVSDAARRAAVEIRREALLPPRGRDGRPLPLLSHWNRGGSGEGWTVAYQMELLQRGHRLLPWIAWPHGLKAGDERSEKRYHEDFGRLLEYCRELGLPICILGTQWEAVLLDDRYRPLAVSKSPMVITPRNEVVEKISPFGPLERWRDPAYVYVATAAMRRAQELYPNPPLVLFVSNNEAPKLRWNEVDELSRRYLDKFGRGRSDEFKRKVVARGWKERYPVLFRAMRAALVSPHWKRNVRFVGYQAFGPSHIGRWAGWPEYSLITDEWTSPNWYFWDGGSPSYYTHNWCPNRDHWVWSTQVESMNWIFQLDEAWKVNPHFWWEISLWDGNSGWRPGMECTPELLEKSKACRYMKDGQTYTPDRFEGWARFGLWLLRPRVLREFRGSAEPLNPWRPYFERLLKNIDRLYEDQVLEEFWRYGKLVPNTAHEHPYQVGIPEEYRRVPRWFLLDTGLDPPRPWTLKTDLPVFSIALELGERGNRRWLVYAHSPLESRRDVEITLPGHGIITVDVPQAGAFHIVDEEKEQVIQGWGN